MTYLRNLRNIRRDKGITQQELDTLAGLPPGTIAQLEQKRREPKVGTAIKIALCLDCSVEELI
jgi:DNA-binding XRE family transcriptional regulator